ADQIRHGFRLPLSARLRPCPRTTDQRRGTLTKQRKPAIIFDTANRSTTTAPAETRGGCKHSSPQCQRAAAAAVPQIPNRYEKSGLVGLQRNPMTKGAKSNENRCLSESDGNDHGPSW